jgi:putative addiction module component (TIGR02574 family)
MSITAQKICIEVLSLPRKSRAEIAERVLASLEDRADKDVEKAWKREALKRYKAFKAGKIKARPHSEVMRDAHRLLRSSVK